MKYFVALMMLVLLALPVMAADAPVNLIISPYSYIYWNGSGFNITAPSPGTYSDTQTYTAGSNYNATITESFTINTVITGVSHGWILGANVYLIGPSPRFSQVVNSITWQITTLITAPAATYNGVATVTVTLT